MSEKKQKKATTGGGTLTEKEELFVGYYLQTFNATSSYQKAYGCAMITAEVRGPLIRKRKRVADEIEKRKKRIADEMDIDLKTIINQYKKIAFATPADYYELVKADGTYSLVPKDINEIDMTPVQEVYAGVNGTPRYKFADKMRALEHLEEYARSEAPDENINIVMMPEATDG